MNFFEYQDQAHKWTWRLTVLFMLAVVAIVVAVNLVVVLILFFSYASIDHSVSANESIFAAVDTKFYVYTTVITVSLIAVGTFKRIWDLSSGGKAVAELVGARRVEKFTEDDQERRLTNIIEEMAIASGVSVPGIYIMDNQRSINAFAAGYSPSNAIIAVTQGTIDNLSRDELQGVIAHEFSHILNGDMRLNIRMMGVLNGISIIGAIGYFLIMGNRYSYHRSSRSNGRGQGGIIFAGLALMIVGYVGVFFARLIKSAVSRQREFLADASAVQFTRNPIGIAGALTKIYLIPFRSYISNPHSEEMSHMFFGEGMAGHLFEFMASHPPLEERIKRIRPSVRLEKLKKEYTSRLSQGRSFSEPILATAGQQFAQVSTLADTLNTTEDAVVDSVGSPSAVHVAYAMALRESMPDEVLDALQTSEGAQALIYSLVIEKATEALQIKALRDHVYDELVDRVVSLRPIVAKLDQRYRLPILDMAIPTLKEMTQGQRDEFLIRLNGLVVFDRKVSLEEYVVQSILRRHLKENADRASRIRYAYIEPVLPDCVLLISFMAYVGGGGKAQITRAFESGMSALGSSRPKLLDRKFIKLDDLDRALEKLRKVAFKPRRKIIIACTKVVMSDDKVHIQEAEFLRAVAEVLDCPMPPIMDKSELIGEKN